MVHRFVNMEVGREGERPLVLLLGNYLALKRELFVSAILYNS